MRDGHRRSQRGDRQRTRHPRVHRWSTRRRRHRDHPRVALDENTHRRPDTPPALPDARGHRDHRLRPRPDHGSSQQLLGVALDRRSRLDHHRCRAAGDHSNRTYSAPAGTAGTVRPRRRVVETDTGYRVTGPGGTTTTDPDLAHHIRDELDRIDPLPCPHTGEILEIRTVAGDGWTMCADCGQRDPDELHCRVDAARVRQGDEESGPILYPRNFDKEHVNAAGTGPTEWERASFRSPIAVDEATVRMEAGAADYLPPEGRP